MNSGGLVRRGDREDPQGLAAGYNEGGQVQAGGQMDNEQLINMALVAIDPNSNMPNSDREAILAMLEEVFGEGAVEALKEEYMGHDEVPAMLTPGEVVIPKNKVLEAGDGNPDAGAQNIMGMVDEMNNLQGGAPADALGGVGGIAAALGGR